jgi:hypothetical protein
VLVAHDPGDSDQARDGAQDPLTDHGVVLHDLPLLAGVTVALEERDGSAETASRWSPDTAPSAITAGAHLGGALAAERCGRGLISSAGSAREGSAASACLPGVAGFDRTHSPLELLEHVVATRDCGRHVNLGHQHRELVGRGARELVLGAGVLAQDVGDGAKGLVAHSVAGAGVQRSKAVDVEYREGQGQGPSAPARPVGLDVERRAQPGSLSSPVTGSRSAVSRRLASSWATWAWVSASWRERSSRS